jgi:hypothetical protein
LRQQIVTRISLLTNDLRSDDSVFRFPSRMSRYYHFSYRPVLRNRMRSGSA